MKRFFSAAQAALLAVLFAFVPSAPASSQAANTQPAGCLFLPTPTPAPPIGSTILTLRCASDGTLQTSGGGGGGSNVTIIGPLGTNVKAASVSITIASDQGTIPISGTVTVNTPAPCATPTCAFVAYQGTSPWVVNTPAPLTTGAHGGVVVEGVVSGVAQPISGAVTVTSGAITVNTPVPCATPTCTFVSYQGTSPWVVNTPAPATTGAHGGVVVEGVASGTVIPVSLATLPALSAGAAVIGAVTESGTWNVTVNAAIAAGTNQIGAMAQGSPAALASAWPVYLAAITGGGATQGAFRGVGSPTAVAAAAATLYAIACENTTAAVAYVQVYSTPAASASPGTSTNFFEFPVPGLTGVYPGYAFAAHVPNMGLAYAAASSVSATTTSGGSTTIGAGINCYWSTK